MNSDDRNDDTQSLQTSLGLGDRVRQEREKQTTRRRVVRHVHSGDLTEEQVDLIARLLQPSALEFGPRSRDNQVSWRIPQTLNERMEALFKDFPGIEKSRFYDVAIEQLLDKIGR